MSTNVLALFSLFVFGRRKSSIGSIVASISLFVVAAVAAVAALPVSSPIAPSCCTQATKVLKSTVVLVSPPFGCMCCMCCISCLNEFGRPKRYNCGFLFAADWYSGEGTTLGNVCSKSNADNTPVPRWSNAIKRVCAMCASVLSPSGDGCCNCSCSCGGSS